MTDIIVDKKLVRQCRTKAQAAVNNNTVKGYRDQYSKGAQTKAANIAITTAGFIAEAAVCVFLGINPEDELTWRADRPDGGYDIKVGDKTVDVKASTNAFASRLMWPVTKMDKLAQAADIFVLAIVAPASAEDGSRAVRLRGWVTRDEFIAQHFKAVKMSGIVDGTPYMNDKSLYSMEQIVQHLGHTKATEESL
jgi:hypothetical protein